MYPIEYRWISVPMPVTNSAIVIDSGSTRNPTSTSKPADVEPLEQRRRRGCGLLVLAEERRRTRRRRGDERARRNAATGQPAGAGLADAAAERRAGSRKPGQRERGMSQTRSRVSIVERFRPIPSAR